MKLNTSREKLSQEVRRTAGNPIDLQWDLLCNETARRMHSAAGMPTAHASSTPTTGASLPNELMAFFQRYAHASLTSEPPAIAALYAPTFIVAGPKGSAAFANDENFLQWLGQLRVFNHEHGMQAMAPSRVQVHTLSPVHVLAQVAWSALFAKTGDRDIWFEIAYLLERAGESWKILSYVSAADQEEEMKKLGL